MSRITTSFLSCLLVSNLAFASEEGATATTDEPRLAGVAVAAFEIAPLQLEAEGPGALFTSIDAAAIDALTHAYLQARGACDPEFMRGGTIHPVGEGYYSYGEIHRANRWERHRISYILKPRDVARFHLYPVNRDAAINSINEQPSRVDLRSVRAVDPLHRPLYILHPSLVVHAYRGEDPQPVEVASLRGRRASRASALSTRLHSEDRGVQTGLRKPVDPPRVIRPVRPGLQFHTDFVASLRPTGYPATRCSTMQSAEAPCPQEK
jgi:hypothetical protein